MASGGRDGGREVFYDELFGEPGPRGEVTVFDGANQGGDDGTEECAMEETS